MPTPLNEATLAERVAAETRLENQTPAASALNANPGKRVAFTDVKSASGVRSESAGYVGGGPGTA